MIPHTDEILFPVLDTDATSVPRYNIIAPDGQMIYQNVALRLVNGIAQEGTAVNKPLLDEFLAASGTTAGTATAYTLAQTGYALFDGAPIRFRLHAASGDGATLNIAGTGAKPLIDVLGEAMPGGIPAGAWITAMYSAAADAYIIAGGGSGSMDKVNTAISNAITAHKAEAQAHNASSIATDTTRQFVSAAEKAVWNAGGGGKVLSNTRFSDDITSVSVNLPADYNYFRIVISEVSLLDVTRGTVRATLNVDAVTSSGIIVYGGDSDGTAYASTVLLDDYVFSILFSGTKCFGAITIDIARHDGTTQGSCRWVTDGGNNVETAHMGMNTFSGSDGATTLRIESVSSNYFRHGMGILVMGGK